MQSGLDHQQGEECLPRYTDYPAAPASLNRSCHALTADGSPPAAIV